ncbi:MYND-type zinc finger-containing chromatin reader ZMYND8 isoform X1 [Pleurodeles waltl]|uniref:MYND-type zinc finger-containing chromatin reader ZMYND8 isoform X1 n=1 Tax=Pleurodeles waltl TaxID=8319 RepID=UPI0037095548
MHPQSLAEEEIKTEPEVVESMDISTRSKDPASAERAAQKRKLPSPQHSSNGHSPQETPTSPIKKKKKPGAVHNNNKDQSELRHGPFYYMKQPLTSDPVDVVPQDGRNDFYCWVCHREGQVLCCELCPRVYHAKCLKLNAEPEGDWFCPECEKITVAECIETQSKAMTLLTIEQLSYLLKFALQKMKQPGTEPFQKPVSLDQHPDYAEYIFHAMDLSTLEKNVKKKMYGCTEAFLADVKWILHNCIIYNGGNHKLTQTAKVLIKICEHEMNEIEVCPECYLSACQKRESWFCEPCSHPHPLVWAKLKGFPFWPAKALRDKEGQVDARFFGQHDRAWVPMNNCYLMSKEIPFSVKKTKSIFNSAMQEMEIYVENIRRKFGVFNYAPFRTPYTPNNQFQMLVDTGNPDAGTVKTEKQEKIKLNFDMTASPKISLSKHALSSGVSSRRISMSDNPRSPMSTNSSVHTGSDVEPDTEKKPASSHFSASEESMDFIDKGTASPASTKTGQAGSLSGSPKPFSPQASTPVSSKQERTPTTGSILNLNLDRSKAEMDLKELSESVLQQSTPARLISPKRQIRSRFQLNLDKTIESCKAQLGINEISDDVYKAAEHSDSEETEKSDSSDSEYISDDEHKSKNDQDDGEEKENKTEKECTVKKKPKQPVQTEVKEEIKSPTPPLDKEESPVKEKTGTDTEKDIPEKVKSVPQPTKEKLKGKDETDSPTVHLGLDSDSESELVIDLGEDHAGREGRKIKKESKEAPPKQDAEGPVPATTSATTLPPPETPILTRASTQIPVAAVTATTSATCTVAIPIAVTGSPVRKQRPLLPKETIAAASTVPRPVWNSSGKFQTSSQKWHMQKVQRQQQQQQTQQQSPTAAPSSVASPTSTPPTAATAAAPATAPATTAALTTATPTTVALTTAAPTMATPTTVPSTQSSPGTRYQTRQAVKAVQQKEITQSNTSTSTITLVTSTQPVSLVTSSGSGTIHTTTINTDLPIVTASADVAADIAKYTGKMMEAIKGTMTEIYNDLSKTTSGSTIAEIRRLRIEIEKLQWLHQQELSEMKHNLELTMAEMRQSLEQERDRLIAEVKKQMEMEKQQSVDETKKKQWCANCKKEAIFYCCWNTSYCDYPCQQAHWPEHMKSCTQSATATQQEPDTELGTDVSNKPTQPNSVQLSPSETANAPKEKDSPSDKNKEGVTVAAGVPTTQPIKLVQVPQTTTFIPATQPTITIPVVVSPTGGAVAMRPGVQYVQTTMPVQVRRV